MGNRPIMDEKSSLAQSKGTRDAISTMEADEESPAMVDSARAVRPTPLLLGLGPRPELRTNTDNAEPAMEVNATWVSLVMHILRALIKYDHVII
jgi:hypothetical protein